MAEDKKQKLLELMKDPECYSIFHELTISSKQQSLPSKPIQQSPFRLFSPEISPLFKPSVFSPTRGLTPMEISPEIGSNSQPQPLLLPAPATASVPSPPINFLMPRPQITAPTSMAAPGSSAAPCLLPPPSTEEILAPLFQYGDAPLAATSFDDRFPVPGDIPLKRPRYKKRAIKNADPPTKKKTKAPSHPVRWSNRVAARCSVSAPSSSPAVVMDLTKESEHDEQNSADAEVSESHTDIEMDTPPPSRKGKGQVKSKVSDKVKPTSGKQARQSKKLEQFVSDDDADDLSDSDFEVHDPVSQFFFYAEHKKNWGSFKNREILEERIIDKKDFNKWNLVEFLSERNLLKSVTYAKPYVPKIVRMFYANLTSQFGNSSSKNFGKVFVCGAFYSFTPVVINNFLGIERVQDVDDEVSADSLRAMEDVLTGGNASQWYGKNGKSSRHASNLTHLFSVLHKLSISNWLPTSNSTSVPQEHVLLMYKIFKNSPVDFGKLIFKKIAAYGQKSSNHNMLLYPSLIYNILVSQGFKRPEDLKLTTKLEAMTVHRTYLQRVKMDLPWINPKSSKAKVADVDSASVYSRVPTFLLQDQISWCNQQIAHLVHHRSLLRDILSSQKGGDNDEDGTDGDGDGTANEDGEGSIKANVDAPYTAGETDESLEKY